MGSTIKDHIAAYKKAVEELSRVGKRKMSMIFSIDAHECNLAKLNDLRDEHWAAIQAMCDAHTIDEPGLNSTRDMCTFYSNRRRCITGDCPHIVGDLAAD